MVQSVRQSASGLSLTEQVNTPPASVEAEQALLGALMLDNHSWEEIAGRVAPTAGLAFLKSDRHDLKAGYFAKIKLIHK